MNTIEDIINLGADFEKRIWPSFISNNFLKQEDIDFDKNKILNIVNTDKDFFIISFLTKEFIDKGKIWIDFCIQNKLKFAIGSCDQETSVFLEENKINYFNVKLPVWEDFTQEGLNKKYSLIFLRWKVVKFLIENKINVLCCDIDCFFIKNPINHFQDADIIFQRVATFPFVFAKKWGFCLCGGFVYCKSSNQVLEILDKVIEIQKYVFSDQWAWNSALYFFNVEWDNKFEINNKKFLKENFKNFGHIDIYGYIKEREIKLKALSHDLFLRHVTLSENFDNAAMIHPKRYDLFLSRKNITK